MVGLGEQRSVLLGRVLDFGSDLIPDLFALYIATLAELLSAFFDLLMRVKPIMGAAKFGVHRNGILMRNPHNKLPSPKRGQV